jgi:beta-galactosidase
MQIDEDEYIGQSEENKKADFQHYVWVYTKALSNNPTKKIGDYPEECVREDEEVTKTMYSFLDMAGYNYYTDKFERLHSIHPERLLVGTETRGNLIVKNWELTKNNIYIVGDFIWTLQDHIGEVNVSGRSYEGNGGRDYPWVLNDGGVIDLNGNILPAIHRFRFAWGGYKGLYLASQPPVYDGIEPMYSSYKWTDTIDSWTYEGYEGKKTFIDVYSDAYEVEVLINSKSLGRKKPEEFFAKFPAVYQAGEVLGIGYDENGKEIYRSSLKTAGEEALLSVKSDKAVLVCNGEDFAFIEISVTDKNGVVKSLPEHKVKVKVEGSGELVGLGSANPQNAEKYTQDNHITYCGKLLAVVRSGLSAGDLKVTISSVGVEDVILNLKVK